MTTPRLRSNPRFWVLATSLAEVLLLLVALVGIVRPVGRTYGPPPFYVDCATLPSPQAFQEVFGRPAPSGVTDIQGAGAPQGGYVWMRLRATDAAIKILTADKKPDASVIQNGLASLLTMPEARRVHWEEALRIRRPECYKIRVGADLANDWLTVVVDRQRHLVYVERFFL